MLRSVALAIGRRSIDQKDGRKELIAKDAKGEIIFSGSINTPEERAGLSAELQQRLEKIGGMRQFKFRPDEDFEGEETRVFQRLGRRAKLQQQMVPVGLRRLDI